MIATNHGKWIKIPVSTWLRLFAGSVGVVLGVLLGPAYAHAEGCPENSAPVEQSESNGEITVSCKCVEGYSKFGGRCEPSEKVDALRDAKSIKDAVSKGDKPPFEQLWKYYRYNRDIAKGLAPEENRCAMVLSMTLGLEPRPGEASLQQLGVTGITTIFKQIRGKMVIPQVSESEIAKRYYIRAQQLADRLQDEWGPPLVIDGRNAKETIAGKKGILFIQNAYPRAGSLGGRSGDHIDVWNSDRIGSSATLPFDKAGKVWFWETP